MPDVTTADAALRLLAAAGLGGKGVQLRLAGGVALHDAVGEAGAVLGGRVTVQRVSPGADGATLLVLHAQVPRGSVLLDLVTRPRALPGVLDVDIGA